MIEQKTLVGELAEQLSQTQESSIMTQANLSESGEHLQKILSKLKAMFNGSQEKVDEWLNTPHPDLDQKTPQSYLDQGKFSVVNNLIYATEAGIPS